MPTQLLNNEEFHYQKCLMVNRMGKVAVTQVRSTIRRPKRQKLTIKALGLGKLHRTVEHEATPQILGMINKVRHLVTVTEL